VSNQLTTIRQSAKLEENRHFPHTLSQRISIVGLGDVLGLSRCRWEEGIGDDTEGH